MLFFRVRLNAHAGSCFRGCGLPYSHHACCHLSAAQVKTDFYFWMHAKNKFNLY